VLLEDYSTISLHFAEWHRWAIQWPESVSEKTGQFLRKPLFSGVSRGRTGASVTCLITDTRAIFSMAIEPKTQRYHGPPTGSAGENQGRSHHMLQPPENKNAAPTASNQNTYTPVKTSSAPMEQATIGRSLVIKGDISGAESLFVDGRIEGTVNIPENRVTVGRNGVVTADVNAREVVIMGKVQGNIICSDRLDIRSEGAVTGDVVVQRISVEDGAILKGSVQVQAASEQKHKQNQQQQSKPNGDASKAAAATAGA
jgi:cytoskeletal protein CcmA (bactofilin family)